MDFRRHVSRALHQDHVATITVLERLEALLGRYRHSEPPLLGDAEAAQLMKELIATLGTEIGPHFAFEEESVFPLLADAGDREMGEYLIEEHQTILPLARKLVDLAEKARHAGFTGNDWTQFHGTGAELIERLVSHVQKEEMGLLPALDDLLDEELDGRLALEFATRR